MPQFVEILEIDEDKNPLLSIDHQNGRIGVGNAAPTATLDITGDLKVSGSFTLTGDIILDDITADDITVDALTATSATITTANVTTLVPTAVNTAFTNSTNVGTANTGVTATERGDGRQHQTVLTFTGLAVGTAAAAADEAFGKLLYTLPAGVQNYKVAYMNVILTGAAAIEADTPDVGIGTVIATGAVATLDGTATFEDIITGQTSGAIDGTNPIIANDNTVDLFVNTADAKTVHLNIADGWADTGAVTATGTVVLEWSTIV